MTKTTKRGGAAPTKAAPRTAAIEVDGDVERIPVPPDMVLDELPADRPRVASARRREIYLHASRLFVEKGYEATSMSDIAAAVKITKAGLYHFVAGKEELLFTIMNFGMDELYDEVVDPARAVADPLERLKLVIRNHVTNIARVTSSQGNPVTIVADEPAGLGPENRRLIDARKRGYYELIRGALVDLRERGDLAEAADPAITAHCIIGMIMWTARWRRPEGRLSVEAVIDQITALALHGVVSDLPAAAMGDEGPA